MRQYRLRCCERYLSELADSPGFPFVCADLPCECHLDGKNTEVMDFYDLQSLNDCPEDQ